jgi:hypothetical protein
MRAPTGRGKSPQIHSTEVRSQTVCGGRGVKTNVSDPSVNRTSRPYEFLGKCVCFFLRLVRSFFFNYGHTHTQSTNTLAFTTVIKRHIEEYIITGITYRKH